MNWQEISAKVMNWMKPNYKMIVVVTVLLFVVASTAYFVGRANVSETSKVVRQLVDKLVKEQTKEYQKEIEILNQQIEKLLDEQRKLASSYVVVKRRLKEKEDELENIRRPVTRDEVSERFRKLGYNPH